MILRALVFDGERQDHKLPVLPDSSSLLWIKRQEEAAKSSADKAVGRQPASVHRVATEADVVFAAGVERHWNTFHVS